MEYFDVIYLSAYCMECEKSDNKYCLKITSFRHKKRLKVRFDNSYEHPIAQTTSHNVNL